jgi:hypothetical protein
VHAAHDIKIALIVNTLLMLFRKYITVLRRPSFNAVPKGLIVNGGYTCIEAGLDKLPVLVLADR